MSKIWSRVLGRAHRHGDRLSCAERAEALGYDSVWVAEGHGGDQFAILAACALRTRRIRLGTAISSVFVRTAPTIAMAAATVDELSGGRFVLGLGSSHRVQVGPEHGVAYERPLERVRETVAVVRTVLREGEVRHDGETVRIEDFKLWFRPYRGDPPVYLSALFPKMMELTGEIADGVILTRSTLASAGAARERLAAGAVRAGRDPGRDRGHLPPADERRAPTGILPSPRPARVSPSTRGSSRATTASSPRAASPPRRRRSRRHGRRATRPWLRAR